MNLVPCLPRIDSDYLILKPGTLHKQNKSYGVMPMPDQQKQNGRASAIGCSPAEQQQMLSRPSLVTIQSTRPSSKEEKLKNFNTMLKDMKSQGLLQDLDLHDSHIALQKKEILDKMKLPVDESLVQRCPLYGHEVTKDYRTKMTDWMVEVCTSFNCCSRTYFLA